MKRRYLTPSPKPIHPFKPTLVSLTALLLLLWGTALIRILAG